VTTIDATGWRPSKGELDRYGREIPDERSLGVLDGITFVEAPNVAAKPPNRGMYVGRLNTATLSIQWCEAK